MYISNKAEILAHLANVCHTHTEGLLVKNIPIAERFNTGDRQIIIELYGEKIVDLSKRRTLRFRDWDAGIDEHTALYFFKKSVKALDRTIDQTPFTYDPLKILSLVMKEFEAIPKYQTYTLILS